MCHRTVCFPWFSLPFIFICFFSPLSSLFYRNLDFKKSLYMDNIFDVVSSFKMLMSLSILRLNANDTLKGDGLCKLTQLEQLFVSSPKFSLSFAPHLTFSVFSFHIISRIIDIPDDSISSCIGSLSKLNRLFVLQGAL